MDNKVSRGVRLLTRATAVRWFGWGLGEAFLPVFFLLFMKSFLGVGLLASVYNVFFFFSIPFASFLADKIHARTMILAALILYIFIGLGYFTAGLFGMAIFLFIARAINGVSYSLDQVGRETYIIRHTPKKEESWIFGRFDLIANFWWMFAVVIGIFAVKYVPINWLLLAIVPTSIIAFFMVLRMKGRRHIRKSKTSFFGVYKKFFNEIKNFSKGLKLLAVMYFTFGVISSIVYFFTPTISYAHGGSLVKSVIIILAYNLPTMFGELLGKIADKKKEATYFAGVLFIALAVLGLMFLKDYYFILALVFLISSVFELFSLTNKGVIARITDPTHLGETDGSLNAIGSLGAVVGPIFFGLMIDHVSISAAYIAVVGGILLLSFLILKRGRYLKGEK